MIASSVSSALVNLTRNQEIFPSSLIFMRDNFLGQTCHIFADPYYFLIYYLLFLLTVRMASRFVKDFAKKATRAAHQCKPTATSVTKAGKAALGTGVLLGSVMAPIDIKAAVDLYNLDTNKESEAAPDYIMSEQYFDQPGKFDEVDGLAKNVLNVDFIQGISLSASTIQSAPTQMVKTEGTLHFGKPKTEQDPAGISANGVVQAFSADGSVLIGLISEDTVQARYFVPLHPAISAMGVANISHSGEEDMVMSDLTVLLQGAVVHAKTQHVPNGNLITTSYMQAIAPHTAAGIEMTHFFGQGTGYNAKISHSTFSKTETQQGDSDLDKMMAMHDQNAENKRSVTTLTVGTNGVASLNHYHKISPQLQLAAEIEHNLVQAASNVTVAAKVDTEVASVNVSANTSGQILSAVEFQPAAVPNMTVNACLGFNYAEMRPAFGVSFKYEADKQ